MNAFSTIKTAINNNKEPAISRINRLRFRVFIMLYCRLTKKAEPPPTNDVNRDSGTDSANGGWLRRLVRPQHRHHKKAHKIKLPQIGRLRTCPPREPARAKTIRTIGSLLISNRTN